MSIKKYTEARNELSFREDSTESEDDDDSEDTEDLSKEFE